MENNHLYLTSFWLKLELKHSTCKFILRHYFLIMHHKSYKNNINVNDWDDVRLIVFPRVFVLSLWAGSHGS